MKLYNLRISYLSNSFCLIYYKQENIKKVGQPMNIRGGNCQYERWLLAISVIIFECNEGMPEVAPGLQFKFCLIWISVCTEKIQKWAVSSNDNIISKYMLIKFLKWDGKSKLILSAMFFLLTAMRGWAASQACLLYDL